MAAERKFVLVVEDDADIRESLGTILEEEGYGVVTTRNGREALSYLRSGRPRPSLILLDLLMPVMSGAEFRAEQERDPALADIPVVVLSGDSRATERASLGGAEAIT